MTRAPTPVRGEDHTGATPGTRLDWPTSTLLHLGVVTALSSSVLQLLVRGPSGIGVLAVDITVLGAVRTVIAARQRGRRGSDVAAVVGIGTLALLAALACASTATIGAVPVCVLAAGALVVSRPRPVPGRADGATQLRG